MQPKQTTIGRFFGQNPNKENSPAKKRCLPSQEQSQPQTQPQNLITIQDIKPPSPSPLPPQFADYQLNPTPKKLSSDAYHPIYDAPFRYGEDVPFSFLANAFEEVSNFKGKNSKLMAKDMMANVFRSIMILRPDQLTPCYYLSIGKLAPDHMGVELGIGNETLYKAVANGSGLGIAQVRKNEKQIGDLGQVAAQGKASQKSLSNFIMKKVKPECLSSVKVYDSFIKIAYMSGARSAVSKEGELTRMLSAANAIESKYIIRIAQKSLKIGASELTMQSSLAKAIALTPPYQTFPPDKLKANPSDSEVQQIEILLKRAINECPDYGRIIQALLKIGPEGESLSYLNQVCRITPGTPVKPMLAQPTKGIKEVLARFTNIEFTCEYKYDGMRAQIHILPDNTINFYSRNAENLTQMFPDLSQFLQGYINFENISNAIIDSEVVAFDLINNKILPFQEIQHRSRKNVDINDINVQVCLYLFDVMYLNDTSLLDLSLHERREILSQNFPEVPGKIQYVTYKNVSAFEEIEQMVYDSVAIGCEGLMLKTLHQNAQYKPNKRSYNWLKLKKDYMEDSKLGDSLDLVPIGAEFGIGKRTGVYGSFLLAIYDEENDEYQTICKIGTGFSDEILQQLYTQLKEFEIERPRRNYRSQMGDMQVWFEPRTVWEVKAADISVSPVHTAAWGRVVGDKGVALRFPRFLRIRPDKRPEDCTGVSQILEMYYNQTAVEKDWEDELI